MKALLLAFSAKQQYHAMRCAEAAGYTVHVLGRNMARKLKLSRYCSSYQEMSYTPGVTPIEAAVEEIAEAARRWSVDVILPSDVVSTRLLTLIADRLPVPVCALPDAAMFEKLNDKWWFYHFCQREKLPTPKTWLFQSAGEASGALVNRDIALPVIVKPTDRMGSSGIFAVKTTADLAKLASATYSPLLVQEYIEGRDCGLAMVCHHGRVVAYSFQRHFDWGYQYEDDLRIRAMAERIAAATNFHGVAHFDVREAAGTGDLSLIECNPRYWYSMFALALAGLNFLQLSLDTKNLDPANPLRVDKKEVRVNRFLLQRFLSGAAVSECDWRTLRYYLADPLPILCERLRLLDDDRAGIAGSLEEQTSALSRIALPLVSDRPCLIP
jgi:glutathione synthase/RimK-type ligase-like ATP-grasp enzyme